MHRVFPGRLHSFDEGKDTDDYITPMMCIDCGLVNPSCPVTVDLR